ncbi:MAG: cytochrome c4 [Methylococcales bacterium]|nr:cytochrome c4 [Methylococcales bacterium]
MLKKLLILSITLTLSTTALVHAKANTEACVGCHGETGNSTVAMFPKLAGQHATYLLKTLQELKKGTRKSPMMAPLAAGLSDEAMAEIADFYAAQAISNNPMPILPLSDEDEDEEDETAIELIKKKQQQKLESLLAKGKSLYLNGNLEAKVSACSACHGVNGNGNQPASYPALKAQHTDYLIKTLTDFQKDRRSQDADNIMGMIAKKMTDEEIQAVSYYISVMNRKK